jgi:hypothetical protein
MVAGNAGPMTFTGTCTCTGEVAVIDPGPDHPDRIAALLATLRGETITCHLHAQRSFLGSPRAKGRDGSEDRWLRATSFSAPNNWQCGLCRQRFRLRAGCDPARRQCDREEKFLASLCRDGRPRDKPSSLRLAARKRAVFARSFHDLVDRCRDTPDGAMRP